MKTACLRLAAASMVMALTPLGVAGAATVARLDFDAATADAGHIVHGDVVASRSFWSEDGLRIYTDVEVAVRETLKGSVQPTVTVRLLGGEVGEIGQMVPGAPRLREGEEVVLLLQRPAGQPSSAPEQILGLSQGLYRISRSRPGQPPTASQELADLELIDVGKQRAVAPAQLPLDQLLQRLRTAAKGGVR